jgi:hypothetical protein
MSDKFFCEFVTENEANLPCHQKNGTSAVKQGRMPESLGNEFLDCEAARNASQRYLVWGNARLRGVLQISPKRASTLHKIARQATANQFYV